MKKLLFDRRDGYRIKHKDPMLRLVPFIMPKRYDAQVAFEETANLAETDKTIRALRKDGHRVIFLHVVLAAMLRTMVDYPKTNRFVKGRQVYARKHINFSFVIKKDMSLESEETVLKITFDRSDTLIDVVNRVNEAITKIRPPEGEAVDEKANKADVAARLLNMLPSGLIRFMVFFFNMLDQHRVLPRLIMNASPFHASAFVADLGSIGIRPVHHHIYDFGTVSYFLTFGTKKRLNIIDDSGNVKRIKQMDIKLMIDERIVDGYYLSRVVRCLMRYIEHPERLLTPPEAIIKDDEIR